MTQELVARLRLHKSWRDSHGELNDAPLEAADEIERLSNNQSDGGAVAWLYEKNGRQSLQFNRQPWLTRPDRGWTETPLYACPQPSPPTPVVGEDHRCPNCRVRFQRTDDVDEHLSALKPAPTDTADRREALRRMSNEARDLNVATALDLLVVHADDATLDSLIAGPPPEGYVAVPVEPTEAMIMKGVAVCCAAHGVADASRVWTAMIAARPQGSP